MNKISHIVWVTFPFPPYNSPATKRISQIALEILARGWKLTVFTMPRNGYDDNSWSYIPLSEFDENPNFRRVSIMPLLRFWGMRGFKKTFHERTREYAGRAFGKFGYHVGMEWAFQVILRSYFVKLSDCDLILASSAPHESFYAADRIAKRLGVPFVIDYRDLWTDNFHIPKDFFPEKTKLLEKRLLKEASLVTVVGWEMGKSLKNLQSKANVEVVTNGYIPRKHPEISPSGECYHIIHAGALYPPHSTLRSLLEAFKMLDDISRKKIQFTYVGGNHELVANLAEEIGVVDMVSSLPQVSAEEALNMVAASHLSVVVSYETKSAQSAAQKGFIPSKIYELMGMAKPVLLIAPEGSDLRRVSQACDFVYPFHGEQTSDIAKFLKERIDQSGKEENLSPDTTYAWPVLRSKYVDLLQEVLEVNQ